MSYSVIIRDITGTPADLYCCPDGINTRQIRIIVSSTINISVIINDVFKIATKGLQLSQPINNSIILKVNTFFSGRGTSPTVRTLDSVYESINLKIIN